MFASGFDSDTEALPEVGTKRPRERTAPVRRKPPADAAERVPANPFVSKRMKLNLDGEGSSSESDSELQRTIVHQQQELRLQQQPRLEAVQADQQSEPFPRSLDSYYDNSSGARFIPDGDANDLPPQAQAAPEGGAAAGPGLQAPGMFDVAMYMNSPLFPDTSSIQKPWCFLCDRTQDPVHAEKNPHYRHLGQLVIDHFGKMDDDTLWLKMQNKYNEHLRRHVDGKPEWATKTIGLHVVEHNPTPYVETMIRIRKLKKVMTIISGRMVLRNTRDATDEKMDYSELKWYLETNKHMELLLAKLEQRAPTTTNL